MKPIHIGKEIQRVLKLKNISTAEFAEMLHIHRQSVYDLFKRDNIDVVRLAQISRLLNYDFFAGFYLEQTNLNSVDWCNIDIDNDKIVITPKK